MGDRDRLIEGWRVQDEARRALERAIRDLERKAKDDDDAARATRVSTARDD